MRKVIIKGAGVLYSEIILTALQEYKRECLLNMNCSRADMVAEVIRDIEFDHSSNNTDYL